MADDATAAATVAPNAPTTTSSEQTTTAASETPTVPAPHTAVPNLITATAATGMLTPSGISTPGAAPATGTVTPALSELPPDQIAYSLKVSLADLCAKAAVLYSQQKNYEEAAEVYARAAEMQAEVNGEMNPANAEILFLYGRALFKVGQAKSDVLGGKAPETSAPAKEMKRTQPKARTEKKESRETKKTTEKTAEPAGDKPLFQFTGDEEWDESDEEEEGAENEEQGDNDDDEDDDLAVAFEVLDLARVLFRKQLEAETAIAKDKVGTASTTEDMSTATTEPEAGADKGKAVETVETEAEGKKEGKESDESDESDEKNEDAKGMLSPERRHIVERLADTHDLLAEISLENERYPNAIVDSRASLTYKQQILPEESEIVAEAHFKLSLALEFASVTTAGPGANSADGTNADASGSNGKETEKKEIDQGLRDEAARELEAAIFSTRTKLQNKEVELATLHSPEDNDATRRQIAEVKDIIADMEQRLVDLRNPIDLNEAVHGAASAVASDVLGAFGAVAGTGNGNVEEVKKTAKDVTDLVRKKNKDTPAKAVQAVPAAAPAAPTTEATASTCSGSTSTANGTKRKAEEPAIGSDDEAKKARIVEA